MFHAQRGGNLRPLGRRGCQHINIPLTGILRSRQVRGERTATPGSLAVYEPHAGAVRDRWSADCRVIGVKIQPGMLERELAAVLGDPPPGPLRFSPGAGVRPEPLAGWVRLVRLLHADATAEGGLAAHPLLSDRLQESVVRGLLAITDHQYRERMDAAGNRPAAPKAIRRVVEAIRARPEAAYTLASLAEIAGLSVRALQQGFQRHAGTTPMTFLRDTRLARAHEDLRRGEPPWVTVAAVAHRWGFAHLGRFAQLYRARYCVAPSETLRR
ncbi:MAG: AraC family transcriptional regulator [Actinoplanes sp.]